MLNVKPTTNIKEQIRHYINQNLLFTNSNDSLNDHTSFLDEGIVDSTGVVELVMFVEETFHISVEDHEIIPDNFDSIHKLAAYIQDKLA